MPYSTQVILCGDATNKSVIALSEKWNKSNPSGKCLIIQMAFPLDIKSSHYKHLSLLDSTSRLYIIAHHNAGMDCIYPTGDPAHRLSCKDISNLLSWHIHPGDVLGLKVSLVACYGAKDANEEIENSFGMNLHKELRKQGFRVDLHARTGITRTLADGSKRTVKLDAEREFLNLNNQVHESFAAFDNMSDERLASSDTKQHLLSLEENISKVDALSLHRQASSLIFFSWDADGRQVVKDAYSKEALSLKV